MSDVSLLKKYRSRGMVIDTNILLLYVVGTVDRSRITTFKRTRSAGFEAQDLATLSRVVADFVRLVTTPHILTEVSNMLGSLTQREWPRYRTAMASLVSVLDDRMLPATQLSVDPLFRRFGLTDTAIVQAARQGLLVLTDDALLANAMYEYGLDVVNFNHLRQLTG